MRWTMLALVFAACPTALAAQATDAAREAEVRAVVETFHEALAAGDSTAALQWLHDDLEIYESGHAETISEYRSGHLGSDMVFAAATRREVTSESIDVWGDQALYLSESRTRGTLRGRTIDSQGTETAVLIRTSEGWRIRHIHWSSGR